MEDRVPVGVFRQLTDRTDREYGSTYRVLGLGLVTRYDEGGDVFRVESADYAAIESITNTIVDEVTRYEVQLYAQLMNEFLPFVKEDSVTYTATSQKRDRAFREIIMREYGNSCAVCGMRFRWRGINEATAAHIIPKHKRGTDDPRNGLALCHHHHWAFDSNLFSFTDDYEIMLVPGIREADSQNFPLLELEGKPILLPSNETLRPHIDAVRWHRRSAFG
jgi:putative restriction endonuclease